MIALQITSMKQFMSQLLTSDAFDLFLLEEATISTAYTYNIDGHVNKDFFAPLEPDSGGVLYEFQPWSEAKSLCFQLIKGKHTPLYFKFVLQLKPENAMALLFGEPAVDSAAPQTHPSKEAVLPGSVKALVLNIKYDGIHATLTTGTSFHTFVMNKEADRLWDRALLHYLGKRGIPCEELT